jgi:subtilisin family serine protease
MIATFRLLIEVLPDNDLIFAEVLDDAVAQHASNLGAMVRPSPNSRPTFHLRGEFPENMPTIRSRFAAYDFAYEGDPDIFAKRFAHDLEEVDERTKDHVIVAPDIALRLATWTGAGTFDTQSVLLPLIGAINQPVGRQRVNVVIVDQGFDQQLFPGNYAGGIDVDARVAGSGHSEHAAMIARNVVAIAPTAKLYDCPLIPTPTEGLPAVIGDIPTFTVAAAALCSCVAVPLVVFSNTVGFGTWVFVNAWAVFDRRSDIGPRHYCDDPEHPLNLAVSELDRVGGDIVFAAGNCGQFDPDSRCDAGVLGPYRSILGANSLRSVLTVGAVRADLVPFGFTSQGPGQQNLGLVKPDLCAPSQFADPSDRLAVSSGTSGATAVAAGVIAALRRRWNAAAVSPQTLRDILIQTVRPLPPYKESRGIGAGLINLEAAAAQLQHQFP